MNSIALWALMFSAAPAMPMPSATGESGLVVIRERDTDEVPAYSAADLLRHAVRADNHSDEGLVEVRHPRGGYTKNLQGRFQEYYVVTRGADGMSSPVCVNSAAQAERLAQETAAPPSAQGGDR